jgi:ribosomal protein S30
MGMEVTQGITVQRPATMPQHAAIRAAMPQHAAIRAVMPQHAAIRAVMPQHDMLQYEPRCRNMLQYEPRSRNMLQYEPRCRNMPQYEAEWFPPPTLLALIPMGSKAGYSASGPSQSPDGPDGRRVSGIRPGARPVSHIGDRRAEEGDLLAGGFTSGIPSRRGQPSHGFEHTVARRDFAVLPRAFSLSWRGQARARPTQPHWP